MNPLRKPGLLPLLLIVAVVGAMVFVAKAWHDTLRDPVVERLETTLPGLPAGTPPLTIALLSDIHVAGPDMPPSRLADIVAQVNALRPDLVLIAGDLVSDRSASTHVYSSAEAVAPLAALTPRLATVVVPGNHDHWRGVAELRNALEALGIVVLVNEARPFGPLAVGGVDDDYTDNADLPGTLARLDALDGGHILLSHSPDPFPDLPADGDILMLAGHTHCGQIGWPWGGSPATMSRYGERYACGVVRENGNALVVTSGLGTSILPFRLFTHPEIWLVTVRGPAS